MAWTSASSLKLGDLISSFDGRKLSLKSTVHKNYSATVYNFEVKGYHSYFVGRNSAWVHNTSSISDDAVNVSVFMEMDGMTILDINIAGKKFNQPIINGATSFSKLPEGLSQVQLSKMVDGMIGVIKSPLSRITGQAQAKDIYALRKTLEARGFKFESKLYNPDGAQVADYADKQLHLFSASKKDVTVSRSADTSDDMVAGELEVKKLAGRLNSSEKRPSVIVAPGIPHSQTVAEGGTVNTRLSQRFDEMLSRAWDYSFNPDNLSMPARNSGFGGRASLERLILEGDADRMYKQFGLTEEESWALRAYVERTPNVQFRKAQSKLANGTLDPTDRMPHTTFLDSALRKVIAGGGATNNQILYRYTSLPKETLETIRQGSTFADSAFFTTSKSRRAAIHAGDLVSKKHGGGRLPEGNIPVLFRMAPHTTGGGVHIPVIREAHEVLFPRATPFQILSVTQHVDADGFRHLTVDMAELPRISVHRAVNGNSAGPRKSTDNFYDPYRGL
jgi:hypothetical protein